MVIILFRHIPLKAEDMKNDGLYLLTEHTSHSIAHNDTVFDRNNTLMEIINKLLFVSNNDDSLIFLMDFNAGGVKSAECRVKCRMQSAELW